MGFFVFFSFLRMKKYIFLRRRYHVKLLYRFILLEWLRLNWNYEVRMYGGVCDLN